MKRYLRRLVDTMRRFTGAAFGLEEIRRRLANLEWMQGQQLLQSVLAQQRYEDPKRLTKFGYSIFSQNDEDGIIENIFARIGTETRFFLEIGTGNGWENNTCALLYREWRGVWVDANPTDIATMRRTFADRIRIGQIEIIERFVTAESGKELTSRWPDLAAIDLLSLDIDGNDYHVMAALERIRARVIVVEYNAKFRPPIDWFMPYDPNRRWDGTDYFGASLSAWCRLLGQKGYVLVGCSVSGVNAFFVREDLARDKFLEPYTAETHYEPARYGISAFRSGHRTQGS